MKLFVAIVVTLFANIAIAGAQDLLGPYVSYELSDPVEMDENPWRVLSVERYDYDLTQEGEPEVCVVKLELIPETEAILYEDFQEVPANDQELYWNGQWVLMSEFENQMDASNCDIAGTQS